jgi:hypothetical protein
LKVGRGELKDPSPLRPAPKEDWLRFKHGLILTIDLKNTRKKTSISTLTLAHLLMAMLCFHKNNLLMMFFKKKLFSNNVCT